MHMKERWQPIKAAPDAGGPSPEQHEVSQSQFVNYLREHGFPRLKNLQLTVFLGGHATKKDAEDLLEHVNKADILIHEMQGWTESIEKIYNDVSQGNIESDKTGLKAGFGYGDFLKTLMAGIYNSKKGIGFSDVPATNKEVAVSREDLKKWEQLPEEIRNGKWSRMAARQILVARITRISEKAAAREDYMLRELCPSIVRASLVDALRENKTLLRVVLFMGTNHKRVADLIKEIHQETNVLIQEGQDERVLTSTDELREMAKVGAPIPDRLADSSLTEILLFDELGRKLFDTVEKRSQRNVFIKQFVERLNENERELLHQTFMSGDHLIISRYVEDLLRKKGMTFGQTT